MAPRVKIRPSAEEALAEKINENVAKGDQAKQQSEEFFAAAGRDLKTLKHDKPENLSWPGYLKACGVMIGRRRADELIAIADKRTSVAQTRAAKADSMKRVRSRQQSAPRGARRSPAPDYSDDDFNRRLGAYKAAQVDLDNFITRNKHLLADDVLEHVEAAGDLVSKHLRMIMAQPKVRFVHGEMSVP